MKRLIGLTMAAMLTVAPVVAMAQQQGISTPQQTAGVAPDQSGGQAAGAGIGFGVLAPLLAVAAVVAVVAVVVATSNGGDSTTTTTTN
jgi:hypothetical protein